MSLRAQLIGLFVALAIVPLLAVGVIDYARSVDALEDVIASQTAVISARASTELEDRYSATVANLGLLAGNTATRALLASPDGRIDSAAARYLDRLQQLTKAQFAWINWRDSAGRILRAFDANRGASAAPGTYVATENIADDHGHVIGRIEVGIPLESIVSRATMNAHVGPGGITAIVDTAGGQYLYAGSEGVALPRFAEIRVAAAVDSTSTRRITYTNADSGYIGSVTPVRGSPFAVLSVGNLSEASVPFARIRSSNLAFVFMITAGVSVLFFILLWRATYSLGQLTLAADQVGRGNLSPSLPPARGDEVGRLASAFSVMITRLRETLAEIEQKRKLAAIGEFSSQISHEIRNPLTSIKLNLQTLERAVEAGSIPADLRQPVTISLREVQRLDRVVRGVLQLGRGKVAQRVPFRLHDAVASAVAATQPVFDRQKVRAVVDDRSNGHHVRGDRALIEGALMNILLNAVESMPQGGEVRIQTADGDGVNRVCIEDDGPGIALADRERIFSPFYTTKPDGSGLGLALAHRTVEEHAGKLWVESLRDGRGGSVFVLEMPVVESES